MDDIGSPKLYIVVSNDTIRNISLLGGCDSYRLYINILLNKNWNNRLTTTLKTLLYQLGRDKQYSSKLSEQLHKLDEMKLIKANMIGTGFNDIIEISVIKPYGSCTEIKCANYQIFNMSTHVSPNILFAIYCYLKMAQDKVLKYSSPSLDTIAERVGVSVKTVQKSLVILDEGGLITITHGKYKPDKSKSESNRYRTHDYGDVIYKVKLGEIVLPKKETISNDTDITEYLDYKDELEKETKIDSIIADVLNRPDEFSPCMFKGISALRFLDCYERRTKNMIFDVSGLSGVNDLCDRYMAIMDYPSEIFVFNIIKASEGVQNQLIEFMKYSKFPVVFVIKEVINVDFLERKMKKIYE